MSNTTLLDTPEKKVSYGFGLQFGQQIVNNLFEGLDIKPEPKPKTLVLDGQQRLTSMYLSLHSGKPVKTRTEKGDDIVRIMSWIFFRIVGKWP